MAPSPTAQEGKLLPETTLEARCDSIEEEPLHMKSAHMLTQDYEISFENNFLGEHRAVLEREL